MGNYIDRTCPACNETERRSDKGLCGDCKLLIEEAKIQREWQELSKGEIETYRLPSSDYNLPYIHHLPHYGDDVFQKAFFGLLNRLGEPVARNSNSSFLISDTTESYHGKSVAMQPELRELLNTIYQEIRAFTKLAYQEGFKDGGNMIGRLANGSLSIDDFNKISTKL